MEEKQSKGLAIASLVLSIVAILGCWFPLLNVFSMLLAVIGLILGIVAIVKKQGGMGIAGTIISALSLILAWGINFGTIAILKTANNILEENSKTEGLDIVTYNLSADGENTVVTGQVANNTGKTLTGVMVLFQGEGTEGNDLGDNCIDATESLAAGATWDFKAICSGTPTQITDAKVTFANTDPAANANPSDADAPAPVAVPADDANAAPVAAPTELTPPDDLTGASAAPMPVEVRPSDAPAPIAN